MAQDKGPVTAADAAAALARGLAAAETLLHLPDQDGAMASIMSLHPDSAPPWNAAAADVVMTAHQGLRDLEDELRARDGLGPASRGGSLACTRTAMRQVVIRAGNGPACDAASVTRRLFSWAGQAERMPAVDERARWLTIRGGDEHGLAPRCPLCGTYSLRLSELSLMIACFYPRCPRPEGGDGGLRILGRLAWSAVTADPLLIWADDVLAEIAEREGT